MTTFLNTSQGRQLAYHKTDGEGPCVVFCGGLKSDMEGTKAIHLEEWARSHGRAFLRFDYSGHGESSGEFTDGCIGDCSFCKQGYAGISFSVSNPVTDAELELLKIVEGKADYTKDQALANYSTN